MRYHSYHDGTEGIKRILSYLYLIWLNFAYYVLRIKSIAKAKTLDPYEEKRLFLKSSESEKYQNDNPSLKVEEYVKKLKEYDVISFDIYDTLIFRAVSSPTDLFWFMNEKIGVIDLKRLRMLAEHEARIECYKENNHYEVTFDEIWNKLTQMINVQPKDADYELELERKLSYANPFMLEVWKRLIELGKEIIIISDMYLPEDFLYGLLEEKGFTGFKKLYVSNKYKKNKARGDLFQWVKKDVIDVYDNASIRIIHVGDNPVSDEKMAEKNGFDTMPYPKTDKNSLLYRAYDMSYMVGSAYRALVNNRIYNGLEKYSIDYEYGFIYGGLFVTGYCHFIHEYCKNNNIQKILFLSRDGDILKKVYDFMYPDAETEYVYWSRKVATKFIADLDRTDYFRRFIDHKVNQNIKIKDILIGMELDGFISIIPEADKDLTDKNVKELKKFIIENWDKVLAQYDAQKLAAKKYYEKVLDGVKKAVAVDIGWAGSGALSLRHMVKEQWDIDCEITGLIAGTNTIHNAEPEATEFFIQKGELVPYLYSQRFNRDLLKKHDLNKNYNVFFELLLSSPTPGFKGFYPGKTGDVYLDEIDISLAFGKEDENLCGIKDIQKGIMDFAGDYIRFFADYPYMMDISGRDAYAPMIVASSYNERYLNMIEKRYSLEIGV